MESPRSPIKAQENKVELIGTYGGDLTHSMSAWTSTSRDIDVVNPKTGKTKRERIPSLLRNLAENGHGTPFEKSAIHFLVTTDIATHIQLLKHRVGVSINGESARYLELKEDKIYSPVDWPDEERETYIAFCETALEGYHSALERLEKHYLGVGMGPKAARDRAKESARFYLPYGNQLVCDVQFNFRSFVHFVKLRYSSHAQLEIRQLAYKMMKMVEETGDFTESMHAHGLLMNNGKVNIVPFS